jgi:hypothetical protein
MTAMALSLLASFREFFLLERAERVVESYAPGQHSRVLELRTAALERLSEARRTWSTLAACALSREAVALLARARAVARDASLDDGALARLDVSSEVPDLDPDPNDGTTGDGARVREALAARDPLYLDGLEPESLARLRIALDRAAGVLRGRVEVRSPLHIRALRWGRLGALVVVALYAVWLGVRSHFVPTNISAGKPVHASSNFPRTPVGHELVDGHPGSAYGVHTNQDDSPSVEIDLLGNFAIDRIVVYNRSDGWWDDCLPLVAELSRDGKAYTEIGRREEHFGFDIPWTLAASDRVGRYVRLRVARHGYLALGLVEVFGMKRKP